MPLFFYSPSRHRVFICTVLQCDLPPFGPHCGEAPPPPGPRYEPGGQTVYRGRDTSGYLFHDGLQLVVGKLPAQMLQLPLRDIAHVVLDRHSLKG